MLTLPNAIVSVLIPFATLFSTPAWRKAQVLLAGAILAPGQRTVAAALRVMGRSAQRDSPATMRCSTGEVLNRAVWSPRLAARILLEVLALPGMVVTADAMHCQRQLSRQVLDQGGPITCWP